MKLKSIIAIGVCAGLMAGCANLNSINHQRTFDRYKSGAFSVDARQRMVLTNSVPDETKDGERVQGERQLRICAEQFPDIFTIASAALSGGGSIIPGASGSQLQGNLAAALNESGSSIARTQTVNLLRESMYRTCERYMSGAIGETELSVQASRDIRAMVAVLAIEQLTGVITPPAQALTFDTVANSIGGSAQMTSALEAAKERQDFAEAQLNAKREDYDDALGEEEACEELAGGPEEDPQQSCLSAKTAWETAKTDHETQKQHYDLLFSLALNASNASILGRVETGEYGPEGRARSYLDEPESIKAVTEAVTDIVRITNLPSDYNAVCESVLLEYSIAGRKVQEESLTEAIVRACMRRLSDEEQLRGNLANEDEVRYIDIVLNISNESISPLVRSMSHILNENLDQPYSTYSSPSFEYDNDIKAMRVEYYSNQDESVASSVAKMLSQYLVGQFCIQQKIVNETAGVGFINVFFPNSVVVRDSVLAEEGVVDPSVCDLGASE